MATGATLVPEPDLGLANRARPGVECKELDAKLLVPAADALLPLAIERESMRTIEAELGFTLPAETAPIIKRVIHCSADFDYAHSLQFSPGALRSAYQALQAGVSIVTDTTMALAGINKRQLSKLGGTAHCFIADADVAAAAIQRQCTRSLAAMDKASQLPEPLIFAIGNAPTALLRLLELVQAGKVKPALVIGVPVGFVQVLEAKEALERSAVPYIVNRGRKGGSNIAAAICNALMYELGREGE